MRFALIGTGLMAQEHIRNLALVAGTRVTALVDPVPGSIDWARRSLAETGHPDVDRIPAFADVAAMLAAGDLADAAIVASPNHTHAAVLEPLLASTLHVLCEKPLCTTIEDARRVVAHSTGRRPVTWVGMEYRFMPPVRAFIDDIHTGATGTLRRLAIHEHRFPFLPKVGDWNRFNRNTGGTMVEKCCHFFDLMRLIVRAEPLRVFCSGAADVNHRDERYDGQTPDIIDNSFTVVDFDNGVRAMLDLCMFAEGAEEQEEMVAIGDAARLSVGIPSGILSRAPRVAPGLPKAVSRRHVTTPDDALAAGHHHGATYFQLLAFLDAIAGRGPVLVSPEDGLRAVAMGTAAEISAREQRVVTMTELGTEFGS